MNDSYGTGFQDKANGNYMPLLHGMQLRCAQQRLIAALLRRPSLVPTTMRSGIQQDDFPEELREAFIIAMKEPDRIRQIVADPNGDSTIRSLYVRVVELGHGQALRIAEQIVFNVRREAAQDNNGETAAKSECQEDDINLDTQTDANGHSDDIGAGSTQKDEPSQNAKESREDAGTEHEISEKRGDPDLAAMNNRYAVVKIGGKTRVVFFEEDATFPGCKVPVFSTIPDFCAFHAKRKKIVFDKRGKEKKIGIGRWWIDHEQRRQFDGIVYAPGTNAANGKLNLWNGFGCEPRAGICKLYLEHLHKNICAGIGEHTEYLLNWMAFTVQHPDRQGEVALVLRGKEGTGKGMAAKQFGRLLGAHFRHIVHAKHLTGHFNAHLQHCSVLFADEAFFAGDRSHESILKALITEETLLIEPKGMDPFPVRNCVHLMMSSNSDWVIPAGADARRYFVLNVGDANIQDLEYFAAIAKQMDNGGREAFLHHLLSRDLAKFDVRLVPQTKALSEQKAHSRRGVDRLIEIICHDGGLPCSHVSHCDVAVTSGEEKGEGFYHAARTLVPDLKHVSSIVIGNELKGKWQCTSWKAGNQRGIRFLSLAHLRELFDKRHGNQDWPDIAEEVIEWRALL
jgi:Family of unknown function (DUF5906)